MKLNNKRIIAFLISLTFVLVGINIIKPNRVLALTSGEFSYTVEDDNTATITGYSGYNYNIDIPKTIDGYKVSSIRDEAFRDNKAYTIVIPDGVKEIGYRAFAGCTNLTDITIPDSVTVIEDGAFTGCKSLKNIVIPSSVSTLSEWVFSECRNLNNIVIPEGMLSIKAWAFHNSGLTNITISKSVRTIETTAFSGASGLREIYFKGDVPIVTERGIPQSYGNSFFYIPRDIVAYVFNNSLGYPKDNQKWHGITTWIIDPSELSSRKAVSTGYNGIKISWNKVSGADGYEVYRSTSSKGPYSLISRTTEIKYNDTGLITNKRYYYKFRAYKIVGKTTAYSNFSNEISSQPVLSIPEGVKSASSSYKSINISWRNVSGANGYEVYRSTSSTGAYTLLTNTTSLNYTNTGLTTNTTYYYKIRAYKVIGKTKVYSGYTTVVSAKPILAVPKYVVAKRVNSTSINLTWGATSGASRYEVYRSTSSTGTYTLLTSTTNLNYVNKGLVANKPYYYKIRAYKIIGKTKVYSGYINTGFVK